MAVRGHVGQVIGGESSDSEDAQVIDVRRTDNPVPAVTWTVRNLAGACDPEFDSTEWTTEDVGLGFSYVFRTRVVFSWRELRSDARATVSAMKVGWDGGYARRLRCRKTSKYRGRCRFSFTAGDIYVTGWFRSRKSIRPREFPREDDVFIRNRGRLKIYNEYCFATGGHHCLSFRRIRFG